LRYDKVSKRFSIASSLTNIKTFPLLHTKEMELIGFDSRPFELKYELNMTKGDFLFRINKFNYLKVWDMQKGTMAKHEFLTNTNFTKCTITQDFGHGKFAVAKPFSDIMHMREYSSITLDCDIETLDCKIITEIKFIYFHRQKYPCDMNLQMDFLRIGHENKNFVVKKQLYEEKVLNEFLIYKFCKDTDHMGYTDYCPVSRIVHN
jgi:hypothetical protein